MKTANQNIILHHCQLKNNAVFLDGKLYFEEQESENFPTFAKSLYKFLEIKYPKFYKMDNLSKLGFLAFECLFQKVTQLKDLDLEKTGLFLANLNSSLQTDTNYWATTQQIDGHPSPSLFVYTLPNIVIGEICIRHKIKGEHGFFVFEELGVDFMSNYVNDLLDNRRIEACAIGCVEYFESDFEANFLWVERGGQGKELNPLELERMLSHLNHSSYTT